MKLHIGAHKGNPIVGATASRAWFRAYDGNPNDGGTGEGQGQNPPPVTDPFATLDESVREWVKTRHENDITKLAKQAYELDKFAGKAVQVPGDTATTEDWAKFYAKIGRPEAPDKYEFQVPTDLPETVPYDEGLAKEFKAKAFDLGLQPKQATALHDWFATEQAKRAAELMTGTANDLSKEIEEANAALQKAWGEPSTETYKTNLELAGRFFSAVDENGQLQAKLSKVGLVGPTGEILVPELAFAFAKAGAAILTEGTTLNGKGDSIADANPFEGEGNLTQIMRLVKSDRDKAITLAKAAGADLRMYGLAS